MQDDDRPATVVETPQDLVDQLPVGVGGGAVRDLEIGDRRELDLDDPTAALACLVEARIDREPVQPGLEPVGLPKLREVPPGSDQRLLDRVACELRVPEDEAGGLVQPHDGHAGKLREGVMIASPGSLDELSLVHRCLALQCTTMVDRASHGMAPGSSIRFLPNVARRDVAALSIGRRSSPGTG